MILKTANIETTRGSVVADLSYTDKGGMFVTALDGAYKKGTRIAQSYRGEDGLIEELVAKGASRESATHFVKG